MAESQAMLSNSYSDDSRTIHDGLAPSLNDIWQKDVLNLLNKIKDELAAGKSSKSDPAPSSSSTEKFLSVPLPNDVKQEEARRLFGVLSQVDAVKTTGGKTYNYEEKYAEDAPGDELGPDARAFKVYNDEAEKYDADMIRGFRDSLDGLLVFASLFSGVVTTILIQTIQVLPTDQSRITNYLLYETTLLLRANANSSAINSISQSRYGPDSNTSSTSDVWTNAFFIASLALSLTTALLSILAKQWMQAYMSVMSGSARDVALIRHLRFTGLEQWKLHEILGALPLILHTSLGFFFAGLFLFVRTIYPVLGWIVISISGVTFLVYLGTIILPTFFLECPFRLPVFYRSLEKAERAAVDEGSRSSHANPLESLIWLRKLSSNATVKHVTAWTIASKRAWNCIGIWDFVDFGTVQMLFDLARTVDRRNTVSARALGQAISNAYELRGRDLHQHAHFVRETWVSKLPRELFDAIEEGRVPYVREIVVTCRMSADTLFFERSPLQVAILRGHMEMVKVLVTEGGADINLLLTAGPHGSALAAAVFSGQLEVVKFLVLEGGADVNLLLTAGPYGSSLAAAAKEGQLEIVRFLVTDGRADVNLLLTTGDYGSALAAAACWGQLRLVKFLVTEGGADTNLLLTAGFYGSALAAAAWRGQLEIVKFLVIDGGADVNLLLTTGFCGSALAAAAWRGQVEIVKFLVTGGADINLLLTSGFCGSALEAAACEGQLELVEFLVREGRADVNLVLTAGNYGSALAAAAWRGQLEIAKFLVKKGNADVNLHLTTGLYGSALAAAAWRGQLKIAKFLVTEGNADVNLLLTTGVCGSALEAAVCEGQLGLVKFFVSQGGADVNLNLTAGRYGSALTAAACKGRQKIVKFLVKKGGADVNLRLTAGNYGSSLAAAACWGQLELVKFLVTQGSAEVNILLTAGLYGSALAAAAFNGQLEVAKFLVIAGGADVNLQLTTGFYGSALAAAVWRGHLELVKFLVTEGSADINLLLTAGFYGSAFEAAACEGQLDLIKFFVMEGHADVNLRLTSGKYGSALAAAAGKGRQKIVKFLVKEGGADIDLLLSAGDFGSALAAAGYRGQLNIVKFLVANGANVNLQLPGQYLTAIHAAAQGERDASMWGDFSGRGCKEAKEYLEAVSAEQGN